MAVGILGLGGVVAATILGGQENLSTDGSFTHRVGVLTSLSEILNLPVERVLLGSGFNSHESLFKEGYLSTSGTFAIDNSFVTILIYTGILGLLSFLVLTGIALKRSRLTREPCFSGL